MTPYRDNCYVPTMPVVIPAPKIEKEIRLKKIPTPVNDSILWRFPYIIITLFTPLLLISLIIALSNGIRGTK